MYVDLFCSYQLLFLILASENMPLGGTIRTRGNLFLPVRLLVWADGRGTIEQADSIARAELQGAPKQKLLQLTNKQKIPLGQAQGDAYLLF
jgi:hypothetical protein